MTDELTSLNHFESELIGGIGATRRTRIIHPYTFFVIIFFCLVLFLPGLRWGLPSTTSWSQDTIAADRTLSVVNSWPNHWRGRYSPLHYFILRVCYEPTLQYWQYTGDLTYNTTTGDSQFTFPHTPKFGLLILIARCVSVMMAILSAVGLAATTRLLTRDDLAATIAAGTLIIGACFTYFAHLGNVDVPSVMWFCWSLFFYVRTIQHRNWIDAGWLGLFGSLAISTKDSLAGAYPGMAIILLITEIRFHRKSQPDFLKSFIHALLQLRWLIGLAAFVLPYLWINGVFHNPDAYIIRMKYWLGMTPDTLHMQQHRYPNQVSLLLATVYYAAGAVGWPMVVAIFLTAIYTIKKYSRLAWVVLLPAISYYIIVIAPIHFVYSRFLFPIMACVCILVGLAVADLIRRTDWSPALRFGLPMILFLTSMGYAVSINLSLMTDTRYSVEQWFEESVDKNESIGAFSKPQYLPRLTSMGYDTYKVEMKREAFDQLQPDYLILSSYHYADFDEEQADCMKLLLSGQLGYQPVKTFRGSYVGTNSSWLGLAGWFAPVPGKISPTIIVLRRMK